MRMLWLISKLMTSQDWQTNNYNTHIAQYLKKQSQLDNEIWSVNRIYQKYFSWKNHTQNMAGKLVEVYQNILKWKRQTRALTLYKVFSKNKEEVWNLSSFLIFCMTFKEKYFSATFINWPNFITWLIVFTYYDVGQ